MINTDILLKDYSQPFLYEQDDKLGLLCCFARWNVSEKFGDETFTLKAWKIHRVSDVLNDTESERIKLPKNIEGYGRVVLECNPCLHTENLLTYSCGLKTHDLSAIYYFIIAAQLDGNKCVDYKVIHRAFNATFHDKYIYYISNLGRTLEIANAYDIKDVRKSKTFSLEKDEQIIRLNRMYNDDKFIITVAGRGTVKSLLIDENLEIIKDITMDGEAVYKCSIYKDYMAYTIKDPDKMYANENRSIVVTKLAASMTST